MKIINQKNSEKTFRQKLRKSLLASSIAIIGGGLLTLSSAVYAKQPNILYIVADDLGYSDLGAFGGEIRTPNLDKLVKNGRAVTNFHTSTVCAVTRAMLYSGTDHHLVGLGTMGAPNDERKGLPGYEGYLNDRALSVAQLLKDGGYHTYIAGKWHLGSDVSKKQTPDGWGFDRSYTLLGGATGNHFGGETAAQKAYVSDGVYVAAGEGTANYYDTDYYTDKLISYINSNAGDGKPFAAFATYTTPHWPLQVPDKYLDKYKGWYDVGYDVIRARRILRQKALGIIPKDFEPSPVLPSILTASPATPNNGTAAAKYINANNPNPPVGDASYVDYGAGRVNPRWNDLTADQKKLYARYMEIYAGMVENLDDNVGRLVQHLKDIGEYENTLIVFHSDNGAEGWPLSAAQDTSNLLPANFAKLGKSGSNINYGLRWAEVGAAPWKLSKGYTTEGGVSVPTIIRLPNQVQSAPAFRDFFHVTDIAPTLLEAAGVELPTTPAPQDLDENGVDKNKGKVVYKGRYVYPISGKSVLPALEGKTAARIHVDAVSEEQYGRAYVHKFPWKAVWIEPPHGPVDGHWQLYNIETDRGETRDVSAQYPDIVAELKAEWDDYLKRTGGVSPLRPRGYY